MFRATQELPMPAPSARRLLLLAASHTVVGAAGFAAGIYALPILIAPEAPAQATVDAAVSAAQFKGQFRRDLAGSDALHWGEGEVAVGPESITLRGRLAPGPDYKLYLSPEFVETEAAFEALKPKMLRVGDVKTFDHFTLPLAPGTDLSRYRAVVVWCETFREFITAASYR
jgi:hypothetical protein